MRKIGIIILTMLAFSFNSNASLIGYADVLLDYSGQDPAKGVLGAGGFRDLTPEERELAVIGDDATSYMSLPIGTIVILGFLDETVIDAIGNDIFVSEIGSASESANISVSSDGINFTFLGVANNANGVSSFDLASIAYTDPVTAIRIEGTSNGGSSPGFDLQFVQVITDSIGPPNPPTPPPTPASTPAIFGLFMISFLGVTLARKRK